MNGGTGADLLIGGLGNDTYLIDHLQDTITEAATPGEVDLAKISIATAGGTYTLADNVENGTLTNTVAFNLTGNGGSNTLTGNVAANTLDGGSGIDTLIGAGGNDTYVVDVEGDTIIDSAGIDTVRAAFTYTLAASLEHLTLTGSADIDGTGTALANTLTGNDGNNVLTGGLGNDTYVVQNAGDTISETSTLAGEIDTVLSSVSWTLGDNLERLTLSGTAAINGTGNALANILTGNGGNNTLDGAAGIDSLIGGLGDDTYRVDLTATGTLQDSITEAANAGTDSVILRGSAVLATPVTLTLAATLEHLDASATGSTKLNLTGNTLANTLTGNDADNTLNGGTGADLLIGGGGSDILIGGAGNDMLTGGADADFFVFNLAADATNRDTMTDFISGTDVLRFDNAIFTAIGANGALNVAAFVAGDFSGGQDASDRIVYNTSTGALYYDADGSGAGAAVQVALLDGAPGLAVTDIFVM